MSTVSTSSAACRKIADTPFPFPWSQFTLVLLLVHNFTVPILYVAYIPARWLAVALAVVTNITYWAMNEVRGSAAGRSLVAGRVLAQARFGEPQGLQGLQES